MQHKRNLNSQFNFALDRYHIIDFTPEISSIKYQKDRKLNSVSVSESVQRIRDFIPQAIALKLSMNGLQRRFIN